MRAGGRWNRPGTRVVYLSGSRSLAVLEMLVHLEARGSLGGYAFVEVEIEERLIEELDLRTLPRNWRDYPAPLAVQELGSGWAEAKRTAALTVPSAIIPQERNVLLNPEHPHFERISRRDPELYDLDPRIAGGRR